MIVAEFERRGFRIQVDGDQLKVKAADHLMTEAVVEYLRKHKEQIRLECRLRVFTRLVQAFGTSHGLLLDDDVILAELDDDDHAELMTTNIDDRQAWAELLAYRLTRPHHENR